MGLNLEFEVLEFEAAGQSRGQPGRGGVLANEERLVPRRAVASGRAGNGAGTAERERRGRCVSSRGVVSERRRPGHGAEERSACKVHCHG